MLRAPTIFCFLIALIPAQVFAWFSDEPLDFAHDVLPILRDRCSACHTDGNYQGGLSMDTREALLEAEVLVPKNAGESYLLDRVTEPDPEFRMPPKGAALTAEEVATLRRWIEQGAPWQDGFSFAGGAGSLPIEPRRPELPTPTDVGRDHPVDRIIDAYLQEHDLPTPPTIDDAAFLRRASLDINGRLPTPEQLDAFLDDEDPEKRKKVVRRLLDDDQEYAEHWLSFWNDLLRNDYAGTGYIDGGRRAIHQWLYNSLVENKPYDQFVRELINPTPDSEGFILGIKWRGVVNASQVPEIQFAQNVGQVFLGINLKCASCHDSFIDSWKLNDAYGLAAIVSEESLEINECDKPTGRLALAKSPLPTLGEIDPQAPRADRLRQLSEILTGPDNGLLPRTVVNRIWQRLMGRGIVHPVDVLANPPWNGDLLDHLASHLADNGYDLKETIALIVTSSAYQSPGVSPPDDSTGGEFVYRGPVARRLSAEQFVDAIWQITGTAPAEPAAKLDRDDDRPVRASIVVADPLMRSLGRPNREQVVSVRPDDLSSLQALDLTNGQVLADLLDRGARNLLEQHPDRSQEDLAYWIFRAALSRPPTSSEKEMALEILGEPLTNEGLGDLLWTVFMLPEFQLIQ
ncbi:hypothetical protein BH23PLA1_BH23PLA1_42910 [soil metagenome]